MIFKKSSYKDIVQFLRRRKIQIGFVLLVFCSILLRFYKFPEWFFFNVDEDSYYFIFRKIAFLHRPVLVSYEIPGGLLAPPITYYFGAIILFLGNGNPLFLAATASFFGIWGVVLVYIVGKQLFESERTALLSTIIYCFSYLINIYNRLSINLLFGPILSLLTYLALIQFIKKSEKKWLWLLSIVFIISTQEGSMISLIFLTLVSLFIFKRHSNLKNYFLPFVFCVSSFAPVLLFDIRHNFLVFKKIIHFFSPIGNGSLHLTNFIHDLQTFFLTFSRTIFVTGPNDLNIQILPCAKYLEIIAHQTPPWYYLLGIFIYITFAYRACSKGAKLGHKIIFYHSLIIFFGLFIYGIILPGYIHEWFFNLFTPAFSLMTGYILFLIKRNWGNAVLLLLVAGFIAVNLGQIVSGTATLGYRNKYLAVQFAASKVENQRFSLTMVGDGCNGFGFRYLFTYFGKDPVKSYVDNQYVNWLYPPPPDNPPTRHVVLIPLIDINSYQLEKERTTYQKEAKYKQLFDNIEVLVLERNTKENP